MQELVDLTPGLYSLNFKDWGHYGDIITVLEKIWTYFIKPRVLAM